MKKTLAIILLLFAVNVWAIPPLPQATPVTGLTDASNVAITGGSVTGITDLTVADGGTGASTLTDHGVLVGSGTSAITPLAVGATGEILVGATGADPAWSATPSITSIAWAKASNIADSATPAIGAALGNAVDLDGTTTITAFDTVAAGVTRFVSFTGVRTLTHNATSLILPGARNILTAVGDRATFISLGSGNWRCHEYLKASGLAIGSTDEQIIIATGNMTRTQAYGGLIGNYNQANDVTITLPAIEKGMNFVVVLGTTVAKYFRLDPNANDLIILDGVASTDGKYVGIASAVQGAAIQFIAIQTGASSYDWAAYTASGAWAAE